MKFALLFILAISACSTTQQPDLAAEQAKAMAEIKQICNTPVVTSTVVDARKEK